MNMSTALEWANSLGAPPKLPGSMKSPYQRAKLVQCIGCNLVSGNEQLHELPAGEQQRRKNIITKLSEDYMPDVKDPTARLNVTFRLYSGCLMAAKTIAFDTRNGANTPETREHVVSKILEALCSEDKIFEAGVGSCARAQEARRTRIFFQWRSRKLCHQEISQRIPKKKINRRVFSLFCRKPRTGACRSCPHSC